VSRWLLTAVAAGALATGLAACGGSRHLSGGRPLRLALSEYRLHPENVRLDAGTLTIFIHNYGRLTHNVVVSEDGQSVAATKPIAPGQSAELDLSLAPGQYLMTSTILSDEALGQYGTLTVG
jgi:plastocyanin